MSGYETLTFLFVAMAFGALTGLFWSALTYWVKW